MSLETIDTHNFQDQDFREVRTEFKKLEAERLQEEMAQMK